MTENGYPVTVSAEKRRHLMSEWNRPPTITVPASVMEEGWSLLHQYDKVRRTPTLLQYKTVFVLLPTFAACTASSLNVMRNKVIVKASQYFPHS